MKKSGLFLIVCFSLLFLMVSGAQARLKIIDAQYGHGNSFKNVTRIVQSNVDGDGIDLRVTNGNLGGDPSPGYKKKLRVKYRKNKRNYSIKVNEGQRFYIESSFVDRERPGWNHRYRGDIRIIRAEYGAGSYTTDVTGIVQSQVRGQSINMKVNNKTMQGDPNPGKAKSLSVKYSKDGYNYRVKVREGQRFIVGDPGQDSDDFDQWDPPRRHGLKIIRARYGAGGAYRNVTSLIQGYVRGNTIDMEVNNDTLLGDPNPGHKKQLEVKYRLDGQNYRIRIPEGRSFVISDY